MFLHPIDCRYEDFQKYSRQGREFRPQHIYSLNLGKRLDAREIFINVLRDAVQVSNSNLMRNTTNTLLASGNAKINPDQELRWIGKSREREQEKFKFVCKFFFVCLEKTEEQLINRKFSFLNFPVTF